MPNLKSKSNLDALIPRRAPHASGSRLVAGLISGTSADGVDAAVVRLSGPDAQPHVELLAFVCKTYPPAVRERILRVAGGKPVAAREISQLNCLLGELFAEAALKACAKARISPRRLAAIGSHGQTIFHQGSATVEAGRKICSSLQIAEPAVIADRTGAPVVANFRAADLAAGGQGAPLVPLLDYLVLRDLRQRTVALNIGGIANVTVIPAGAKPEEVLGFDTGPGNMVMDVLVRHFTRGRKSFDSGGRMAERGKVLEDLLAKALQFPFFHQPPPKSAGREDFGEQFVRRFFLSRKANAEDLLRTASELTARTIASAFETFVAPRTSISRLIVSGGGARNRLLLQRLCELLPAMKLYLSDDFGLPIDAKEAIAFALLADRALRGLPGNLPAVTGASRAVVLGSICRV